VLGVVGLRLVGRLIVVARGLMVRAASVDYYAAHKQSDASSPTLIGIQVNVSECIGFRRQTSGSI